MAINRVQAEHVKAIFYLSMAAVFFSLMGLFVRTLRDHFRADTIVFYRSLVQTLILLPLYWRELFKNFAVIKKRVLFHLLRGGLGLLSMYFLYLSYHTLPLGLASLMALTSIFWATLFSRIFLKERMSFKAMAYAFVICLGLMVSLNTLRSPSWHFQWKGIVYGLSCGFFMGAALSALKSLRAKLSTGEVVFFFSLWGVVLLLPICILFPESPRLFSEGRSLIYVGVVATIAQLLMTYGFKYAPTMVASVCHVQTTFLNLILGFYVLGEVPPIVFLVGMFISVLGFLGLIRLNKESLILSNGV